METQSASDIELSTERLLQDLQAIVQDGEELLKAGTRDLSEGGKAAREKLAAALEAAKETQRRLQERTAAGARFADQTIRAHPYQTLSLAFGAGLLIGILAIRR